MRKIITILVLCLSILAVGCTSKPTVVPVAQEFNAESVLVKPPEFSMQPPVEPKPLSYGADNSSNSDIIKENNLNAALDRGKLKTLQDYVRKLFSSSK